MSNVIPFTQSIWSRRRMQARALTAALQKRELRLIELSDEELQMLRRADTLAREMRLEAELAK